LHSIDVIDLLGDLDGAPRVIDFETVSAARQEHDVRLSDQLTAY